MYLIAHGAVVAAFTLRLMIDNHKLMISDRCRTKTQKGVYMSIKQWILALGCSALALGCTVQPADLPAPRSGPTVESVELSELTGAPTAEASEASEFRATEVSTLTCNDSACFQACTSAGACDGFCVSERCLCFNPQGPPCS